MALTPAAAIEEIAGQASLHGLDLEPTEALRLLNEAHTDMCVRAQWTRARVELGPTVADQYEYTLPETVAEVLAVYLDGLPLGQGDEEQVAVIGTDTYLRARGIWYLADNAAGAQVVGIHPMPETGGSTLTARCVVYPTEFAADGAFRVPPDYRRALINYVRYVSLGSSEDDSSRSEYAAEYESEVERLRRHRITRAGRAGAKMRIRGVTA